MSEQTSKPLSPYISMNPFYNPKCKYGQPAREFCSSAICSQYPALCKEQNCRCSETHQTCTQFVSAKSLIQKLMETPPGVTLYSQIVQQLLDGMVGKLHELSSRFKVCKNRKWKNETQKQILSIVKTQDFDRLSPGLVKSLTGSEPVEHELPNSETFKQLVRRINEDFQTLCANIEGLLLENTESKKQSLKFRKTCLETLKFQSGRSIDYLELRSTQSNMVFNRMDVHIMKYDTIYYLQLRSQGLGVSDIESLGKVLGNLTTLDLCECEIDDPTAIELANYFPKLNILWLRKNNVGDEGALAIANRCQNLTYLNLARNPIGDQTKSIVKKKLQNAKVCT